MSEMVERVAKAMRDALEPVAQLGPDGRSHPNVKDEAEFYARAAIAAMREPTEAMVNAASRDDACDAVWRDMIDEALK